MYVCVSVCLYSYLTLSLSARHLPQYPLNQSNAEEFFLPLFFAYSGIRTNLGSLDTPRYWYQTCMSLCLLFLSTRFLFSTRGIVLAVVLIASLAKFIPAYFMTKYVAKKETDFAVAVGVLMNTRGLITLIGVNIGVDSVCHLFLHLCASV
jgi:Kef-type K+ transport system membrane component KefB